MRERRNRDRIGPDPAASEQRREGYRVAAPSGHPSLCIRHSGERYRVLNLSVVGLALEFGSGAPLPALYERWDDCTLEFLRDRALPCRIEVRRVAPGYPGLQRLAQVGFRFVDLPDDVERELQAMLLDVQWNRA